MTIGMTPQSPVDQHLALLQNLTSGGVATVPPFSLQSIAIADPQEPLAAFYEQLQKARVADAPSVAPELDLSAAVWGGLLLHWACWAILDRGQADTGLPDPLVQTIPDATKPASHWSVDLILAAWPDVHSRCTKISEDDPLSATIRLVACRWPLSAIGMKLDEEIITSQILTSESWKTILSHASLRRIAMDRAQRTGEQVFFAETTRSEES